MSKSVICGDCRCKNCDGPKENPRTFFSLKIKSSEKQNVYTNYLYRNLNFLKIESKNRKILIGKFVIFSSGLVFKEKLFKFSSSFLLSIF